eukprot:5092034-Prymnesium_polylepis.1
MDRRSRLPSLGDLALHASAEALLRGEGPCAVGALAAVPEGAAAALCSILSDRLGESSSPIEVLRLFYGGTLERLRQSGATDEWADEALGCGLRGLSALQLTSAKLSEFGIGQLVCGLPRLRDLSLSGCKGVGAASVALLGRLHALE